MIHLICVSRRQHASFVQVFVIVFDNQSKKVERISANKKSHLGMQTHWDRDHIFLSVYRAVVHFGAYIEM